MSYCQRARASFKKGHNCPCRFRAENSISGLCSAPQTASRRVALCPVASQLVAPLVKGIQSNNLSACVKHFIFNNHECNRQTYSANVDERTGRELYAPAFLAAVDAGVGSVMCAFNRVNNTFSCLHLGRSS